MPDAGEEHHDCWGNVCVTLRFVDRNDEAMNRGTLQTGMKVVQKINRVKWANGVMKNLPRGLQNPQKAYGRTVVVPRNVIEIGLLRAERIAPQSLLREGCPHPGIPGRRRA